MALSDKFRLPAFTQTPTFRDLMGGAMPTLCLFASTVVSYLLRDIFAIGALFLFFMGMAVFAWMSAWEMVGGVFRRRSIAWSAAFALIQVSDDRGLKPSVYIFWVVFMATLAFAFPNQRSFRNGTESSATLARDWFLALLGGSAAIAYAVALPYAYVPLASQLTLSALALAYAISTFTALKSARS